jgi:hypothetical protein
MRRLFGLSTAALVMISALIIAPMTVLGEGRGLAAVPWVFVGTSAQCSPSPAGSKIVTSAWLGGMGLPDNGGLNGAPTTANDPHRGLLLNKNGLTSDCSSAGATITGVKGMTVTATFELGYDYRNGGHCGAGAPRFNVDTDMGFFFVGCTNAPKTASPQDPAEWSRTRSIVSACGVECFPGVIPVGAKIKSIDIVFDEGTDIIGTSDPNGIGLAVIDNIDINGKLITSGSGMQPGGGGRGDNNGEGGKHGQGGDNEDGGDRGN